MRKPMGIAKTLAMAGLLLAGVAMAADPEKPLQSSVGDQMADLGPRRPAKLAPGLRDRMPS